MYRVCACVGGRNKTNDGTQFPFKGRQPQDERLKEVNQKGTAKNHLRSELYLILSLFMSLTTYK